MAGHTGPALRNVYRKNTCRAGPACPAAEERDGCGIVRRARCPRRAASARQVPWRGTWAPPYGMFIERTPVGQGPCALPQVSDRPSVGADVLGGPRRPGKSGAGAIFQYNPSFSCRIIQNVARQDTKNPVGQARGGAFLPRPACIIPKPVKKHEKLFIAPKVRQVLYETSQRVFTRCACAQRTGFLIKFFNQESVSGRLGQILRKLWQSVHWSMEG